MLIEGFVKRKTRESTVANPRQCNSSLLDRGFGGGGGRALHFGEDYAR
jgi:hypothetical protein